MSFTEMLKPFRNSKGQVSIEAAIGAVIFFLGFYIFLIMYDAIASDLLFPLLTNSDGNIIANGSSIVLVIQLIPIVMAIMGIVVIVRSFRRPPPQVAFG